MNDLRESAAAYIGPTPATETAMARLCSKGASALTVMELLGLVLGQSTQDAHHFLGEFVDLSSIGRANVTELQQVHGVGPALAARVMAALELGRRNMLPCEEKPQVRSPADAYNLVAAEMKDLDQEHLKVIVLDTKNYVLGIPTIYVGSVNTSLLRSGEIFRHIMKYNAVAAIIAHNHPSGDPTPSPEDVTITTRLCEAGRILDIEVLDHIIIGQGRFVSLKERGLGGFK